MYNYYEQNVNNDDNMVKNYLSTQQFDTNQGSTGFFNSTAQDTFQEDYSNQDYNFKGNENQLSIFVDSSPVLKKNSSSIIDNSYLFGNTENNDESLPLFSFNQQPQNFEDIGNHFLYQNDFPRNYNQYQKEQTIQFMTYNNLEEEPQQSQSASQKRGSQRQQIRPSQSINKKGQKSCEETKNLFVLSVHFIVSRLKDGENEKRWKFISDLNIAKDPKVKLNSLIALNKILKEVEDLNAEKNRENQIQDIVLNSFRACVNDILDYDYVKYAQNQKDDKTQYIFLKYQQSIKIILNNKSNTFKSVKEVKRLLDQYKKSK